MSDFARLASFGLAGDDGGGGGGGMIGNILRMLSSPAGQAGAALLGGIRYNRSYRQAQQANLRRYHDILAQYADVARQSSNQQATQAARESAMLGQNNAAILGAQDQLTAGYRNRLNRILPQITADNAKTSAGYANANRAVMDALDSAQSGVMSGYSDLDRLYADRLARARGIVGGISDQDKQDANEAYDRLLSSSNARLANRGYGSSTIQTAQEGDIARGRGAELRRVSDNRAARELGVESQFGGEALAAKERGIQTGGQFGLSRADAMRILSDRTLSAEERMNAARYMYDTSLSGDVLAQQGQRIGYMGQGNADRYNQVAQANQNALNLYLQNQQNRLNFMANREDPYPQLDPNQFAQLGYNAGPLPATPPWYQSILGPGIQAGGQIGSAAILAGAL